jgi:hypothetical protein
MARHTTRCAAISTIATIVVLAAAPSWAQTPAPLDMKGTWKGTGEAIIDGLPTAHPPAAAGTSSAGNYRLRATTYTYKIEGQDGRRFWGTVTSDAVNERLLGSLSADGKWIYMAGKDGILDGQFVDADTIEMCYRQVTATAAIVACNQMKRQK